MPSVGARRSIPLHQRHQVLQVLDLVLLKLIEPPQQPTEQFLDVAEQFLDVVKPLAVSYTAGHSNAMPFTHLYETLTESCCHFGQRLRLRATKSAMR